MFNKYRKDLYKHTHIASNLFNLFVILDQLHQSSKSQAPDFFSLWQCFEFVIFFIETVSKMR